MMKEDNLKEYSVFKGYDFFFERCNDKDKLANTRHLKYLEEDYLGFKSPEKYSAFTNNYVLGEEPYSGSVNFWVITTKSCCSLPLICNR